MSVVCAVLLLSCPAQAPARTPPKGVTLTQARERLRTLTCDRLWLLRQPRVDPRVIARLDLLIAGQQAILELLEQRACPPPPPIVAPVPRERLDFNFRFERDAAGGYSPIAGGEPYADPFGLPAGSPGRGAPPGPAAPPGPTAPPGDESPGYTPPAPPGTMPRAPLAGGTPPGGMMRLTRQPGRTPGVVWRVFTRPDGRREGMWIADSTRR